MQICPQFWLFCKFFSKKSSKLCPSVAKEDFDVGFCDGLSETFHKDGKVLEGDIAPSSVVESIVDFLGGDNDFCFHIIQQFRG